MTKNKPFDHDAHCRALDQAENYLRGEGKEALAVAVGRARAIHFDMQSRHATATRVVEKIRRIAADLEREARTCDQYVIDPKAPWLGTDLFPVEVSEKS